MKIKDFFAENKLLLAAFLLPALLALAGMAISGIYPFGDKQIAVIDMYHQYVPFLSELQHKLQEGGSLFYTWNGAGGSNFWNLLAYYGASPLNLILALFPEKMIMEGVTLLLLIKIALAGGFMFMYLRYAVRRVSCATVAFSTMYALCSYVLAYYWCIMWMDAVALLPLCILGLSRLMDGGRPVMYTVSLALIVFTNYYVAIMVCIFIFCYYPALYFLKNRWSGIRSCAVMTGKAAGFSLLAIAMAAVMLLPTYLSMQSTYYISADMPDSISFYNDALDVINQLLPYSELTYRDGLPNLCCGMLTVMMFVFYMTERSVRLKEKLINAAFLLLMFLSLNINVLDFIWHGFHFPNQLPYRYTFVICFVLIGMAYKAFTRFGEVSSKTVWTVLIAGAAYYVLAQKILKGNIDDMNLFLYGGMAWLMLYCAVMLLRKRGMITGKSFALLIAVMVAAETLTSVCVAFDTIGNTQRASYFENYEDVTALADSRSDEMARMEIDYNYILNCPALYHYKGLSQFSSSINADTTELMEKIGLEGEPGKNRFNYNQTNPVTNAMLNVKYMITKNLPLEDPDFKKVESKRHSTLYESAYPLSIGYMTGSEIRTWDTDSSDPFEVLDSYVRAATSNRYDVVFEEVEDTAISAVNADVSSVGDNEVAVSLKDTSRDGKVVIEYESDETQKYYLFIEADNADEITAFDSEAEHEQIAVMSDCGSVINLGVIEAGKTFDISVKYQNGEAGDITYRVCTLDYDAWDGAYDILSQHMMRVTDSGDSYIEGTIDAGDGGVFVTSVPYESGWTLKVDGEEREIQELAGGVFISAALDGGKHEIELSFRPPGLIAGLIITIASVLLLVLLTAARKRRHIILARFLSARGEAEISGTEVSDCNRRT